MHNQVQQQFIFIFSITKLKFGHTFGLSSEQNLKIFNRMFNSFLY